MSVIEGLQQPIERQFDRRRLFSQLSLVIMRAGGTIAKFLLAIYTARYLGLVDLGIYGLLVGATTIVPAILGLGMTDWVGRKIVDLPSAQALSMIASRLSLTLSIHFIAQPLALAAVILLGESIPLRIAVLCGAILLLENLGGQAADLLIARRRIFLAYWLTFLRMGLWPIPVMAIGLVYPETRTLEFLLLGWLAMLAFSWVILFGLTVPEGRWRHLRPRWSTLFQELHGSLTLYVKDVSSTASMFLDRFLISMFLGLELTGVYTLFWSIANVMHSLSNSVLQAQLPHFIASAQNADRTAFRALERRSHIETAAWALLFVIAAAIVTPLLLPFIHQPLVQEHLPIFWMVLFATLLRVAADVYGFSLLALHRDRALAIIAVGGALASAGLTLVLTLLAGLWGAALAYAFTSAGLLVARLFLSRPEKAY
jgi:O-antigen/teichoic acid export membrane protein